MSKIPPGLELESSLPHFALHVHALSHFLEDVGHTQELVHTTSQYLPISLLWTPTGPGISCLATSHASGQTSYVLLIKEQDTIIVLHLQREDITYSAELDPMKGSGAVEQATSPQRSPDHPNSGLLPTPLSLGSTTSLHVWPTRGQIMKIPDDRNITYGAFLKSPGILS